MHGAPRHTDRLRSRGQLVRTRTVQLLRQARVGRARLAVPFSGPFTVAPALEKLERDAPTPATSRPELATHAVR